MIEKAKKILNNQKGQTFIENALYIILIVLIVAGAGYALANSGIKPKYTEIQNKVSGVTVPDVQ